MVATCNSGCWHEECDSLITIELFTFLLERSCVVELTKLSERQTTFRTLLPKVEVASPPAELPIVVDAYAILNADAHLKHHAGALRVRFLDEHLEITGTLPSFFLKQVAQERLRALQVPIVNETSVRPR